MTVYFRPPEPERKQHLHIDLGARIRFLQGRINNRGFLIATDNPGDGYMGELVPVRVG